MGFYTLSGGIRMPLVGVGTFMLSPDDAQASVSAALKAGCRLVDTANAYMNEKAVGRAIRASGVSREDIFLESKLWPSFYEQPDGLHPAGGGAALRPDPGHRALKLHRAPNRERPPALPEDTALCS